MAERTIIIIPPKYMDEPLQLKHLRVAAYCRVSTATEEQSSSLESQILYYTAKIAESPLWTNAGVYGEAVTGRNTKERSEFKKLMVKCRKHKVDMILTKSISRFGRNALDEIRSIRELQRLGIDIFLSRRTSTRLTLMRASRWKPIVPSPNERAKAKATISSGVLIEDFKMAHPGISASSVMVIVAIRNMAWSLSLTRQRLCK